MQCGHKIISSQEKLVNDFINFKLVILNVIKINEYYLMEFSIFNES